MTTPDIIRLNETDSTNEYLRRMLQTHSLPEWTVVTTEFQTAGKGQKGASWESARGENIMMSYLLRPHFLPVQRQFLLSETGALAITKALNEYTEDIRIKWPNDIYWRDLKICGTLLETEWQGNKIETCISGNGINVNQTEFLSDAPNPVSLRQITGQTVDREEVLHNILRYTMQYYEDLKEGKEDEIMTAYHQQLYRNEGFHPYEDANGCFEAEIVAVAPSGQLTLRDTEGNERPYWFKEVKYLW